MKQETMHVDSNPRDDSDPEAVSGSSTTEEDLGAILGPDNKPLGLFFMCRSLLKKINSLVLGEWLRTHKNDLIISESSIAKRPIMDDVRSIIDHVTSVIVVNPTTIRTTN